MNFDLNTAIAVREREDGLLEKDTFDLASAVPVGEADTSLLTKVLTNPGVSKMIDTVTGGLSIEQSERFLGSIVEPLANVGKVLTEDKSLMPTPTKVAKGIGELGQFVLSAMGRPVSAAQSSIGEIADKKPVAEIMQSFFKGYMKPEEVESLTSRVPFHEWEQGGWITLVPRATLEAVETYLISNLVYGNVAGKIKKAYEESKLAGVKAKVDEISDAYANAIVRNQEEIGVKFPKDFTPEEQFKLTKALVSNQLRMSPKFGTEAMNKQSFITKLKGTLASERGSVPIPKVGSTVNWEGQIGTIKEITDERVIIALGKSEIVATLSQLSLPKVEKPKATTGEGKVEGIKIEPIVQEAITNTQGAKITPEGIELDISRYQKQEQFGSQAIRTGVFYLPEAKSPYGKYYSTGKEGYGGGEKITGRTTYRNPIIVKAGTGGKGVEKAYDQVEGKGAYQKMRSDVLENAWTKDFNRRPDENAISVLLEKYGGNPNLAYEIIRTSKTGNLLPYAIQEHIAAHALRKAGYDAVISHSISGGRPRLAEVFDLRAEEYPSELSDYKYEDFYPKLSQPTGEGKVEVPEEVKPIEEPIKINNLKISEEAKAKVEQTIEEVRPELEKLKGETLTHEEILEAAKTSDILTSTTSREATKVFEAKLLRTRQHLAALAEQKGVSPEFIETLKAVRTAGTDLARGLGSLRIEATGEEFNLKTKIVNQLSDMGVEVSRIIEAAEGIDFTNQEQVTNFYRKFIKPKLWDIINEYRYINLLSSPKTHIVNAFSNLLQVAGLAPGTKVFSGDLPGASAFYKGAWKSIGPAWTKAIDALKGKTFMERPDVAHIPTGTKALKMGRYIPQALEAGDVFFRTIAYEGELASQLEKGTNPKEAAKIAKDKASYYVFRKALDPKNKTGQGTLLSAIDNLTSLVYKARSIPVFGRAISWYIPFIQTPMNIAKQMIEYSPAGFSTMPGSKNKMEQLAKALLGSLIFGIAAYLVSKNESTWSVPTNRKEKDLFFEAGRQPFSIKIGNTWIGYSRLGPLAFPIAIPAAIKFYTQENPNSATDNNLQKTAKVIGGLGEFFASMSYVEGIGQLMGLVKNAPGAAAKLATQAPSQLIPVSSLQRWVNNFIIDPIYRKTDKEFSAEAIIDEARKSIIFATKGLPAYESPEGEKSRRSYPGLNAFSPIPVTKSNREYEEEYKQYIEERKESLIEKKESGDEPRRRTRRVR